MSVSIIIIGGGQAAVETALSLRAHGWSRDIVLVSDEVYPPYRRPELSKKIFIAGFNENSIAIRPVSVYTQQHIAVILNSNVDQIDRKNKVITLSSGSNLSYERLIIATGAKPRQLDFTEISGCSYSSENIHYLRTLTDAMKFKAVVKSGTRLAIIGGGYLGLEVASVAASIGAKVSLIEISQSLLSKLNSAVVNDYLFDKFEGSGVMIYLGSKISNIIRVGRDIYINGSSNTGEFEVNVDEVLVASGGIPRAELAINAQLDVKDGGILVDVYQTTSDPNIMAVGDCALSVSPYVRGPTRIESVFNAIESARVAARYICGKEQNIRQVPWFWSDQFDIKIRSAGLAIDCDDHQTKGSFKDGKFSVFHSKNGELMAVDSINDMETFMWARKALIRTDNL